MQPVRITASRHNAPRKLIYNGTALTEEQEFRDIYGMDVIEIPTNKPVVREDHQDAVYKTQQEKRRLFWIHRRA